MTMRFATLLTLALPVCLPRLALAAPGDTDTTYLPRLAAALAQAESGHWEAAGDAFRAAALLDPDDALAYLGLGLSQLAARRPNEAAPWFRLALTTARADAPAMLGIGLCGLCLGQTADADAMLARALSRDAQLPPAHFYRAIVALTRDQPEEAADRLRLAREQGVPSAVIDAVEALRQVALGRTDRATELLDKLRVAAAAPSHVLGEPGLPWPLPLDVVRGAEGHVALAIPTGLPLSTLVAARPTPSEPAAKPAAANGPLTVDQPVPDAVVNGMVTIRATLFGARNYEYLQFSTDGKVRGITNREPFYAVWDTSRSDDGPHQVEVRAMGAHEVAVTFPVLVRNKSAVAEPSNANPYDSLVYRGYAKRLTALMIHRVPPGAVETMLLDQIAAAQPAQAIAMCERMLVASPDRTDLVDRLLKLYQRTGISLDPATLPEPHEGEPGLRRVALTFDDGPRPGCTEPILDLLAAYHAKATFLPTGLMSEKYPDLLRKMAAGGHEIGSHTYNHYRLDTISPAQQVYEMVRTKLVLDEILGRPAGRFMRPPGGHYNAQIRSTMAALGYWPVFWDLNCGSYLRETPEEATDAIMRRIRDGSILLLHNGADNTLPLLPVLLDRLVRAQWHCVTLSEILTPAPGRAATHRQPADPNRVETYAGHE